MHQTIKESPKKKAVSWLSLLKTFCFFLVGSPQTPKEVGGGEGKDLEGADSTEKTDAGIYDHIAPSHQPTSLPAFQSLVVWLIGSLYRAVGSLAWSQEVHVLSWNATSRKNFQRHIMGVNSFLKQANIVINCPQYQHGMLLPSDLVFYFSTCHSFWHHHQNTHNSTHTHTCAGTHTHKWHTHTHAHAHTEKRKH
jgi:hypothetical protein